MLLTYNSFYFTMMAGEPVHVSTVLKIVSNFNFEKNNSNLNSKYFLHKELCHHTFYTEVKH